MNREQWSAVLGLIHRVTHRGHIEVNFGAASNIFAEKAGPDQFVVCATFKNWSDGSVFTGEISTKEFNWPKQFCSNDPRTNTAKAAF